MLKKVFTLVLALAMVLALATTALAVSYTEDGNGFTVRYDDGSRLVYNARGDTYTYYMPDGTHETFSEEQLLDVLDLYEMLSYLQGSNGNTSISKSSGSSKSSSSRYSKYSTAEITDAYWQDTGDSLAARWDADYRGSANYSVILYRDGKRVTGRASDGGSRLDFTEDIARENKTGDYYFVIKAKWPGKYTDEAESNSVYVGAEDLRLFRKRYGITATTTTTQTAGQAAVAASAQVANTTGPVAPVTPVTSANADGWYTQADGSKKYLLGGVWLANGWRAIGDKWYCFDQNGVLRTNQWIQNTTNPSVWYYVGANGEMVKNQYVGQWYLNAYGEYHAG